MGFKWSVFDHLERSSTTWMLQVSPPSTLGRFTCMDTFIYTYMVSNRYVTKKLECPLVKQCLLHISCDLVGRSPPILHMSFVIGNLALDRTRVVEANSVPGHTGYTAVQYTPVVVVEVVAAVARPTSSA